MTDKKIVHLVTLKDIYFVDTNDFVHGHTMNYNAPQLEIDEGFLFGLSFFETILVLDNGIFIDEHLSRLNHSLETFSIPYRLDKKLILKIIEHYKIKNESLKICVSEKNIIVTKRPLTYTSDYYEKGAAVKISQIIRSSKSFLINHKSTNYGDLILSLRQAHNEGYNDCLFTNEKGFFTESCIANLFILKDNQLCTPPISDGLLPGIVRDYITKTFDVIETHLSFKDLVHCDGAFLTNSLVGLINITSCNGQPIPTDPIQQKIAKVYFDHIYTSN